MSSSSDGRAGGHHDESVFVHGTEQGPADLPHATRKGYITGFVLSVILTIVPFWLVIGDVSLNKFAIVMLILGFGVVQIFVHVVYFLHMNSQSEQGWNLMAFLFTLILVTIALAGSIWIMFNMNLNMMPMSPLYSEEARAAMPELPLQPQGERKH